MNKSDLVAAVAAPAGQTKTATARVIDEAIAAITAAVVAGDVVRLSGFGTFEARDRAPRTGRNPRTGDEVRVPAARVPAFKASRLFREVVKDG